MLLYMVCYKTSPDSYQSYWDIQEAETPEKATEQARKGGLFQHGRFHLWTVPYNREGMTPEETYTAYRAERIAA